MKIIPSQAEPTIAQSAESIIFVFITNETIRQFWATEMVFMYINK